jgi:hypothetical protein
LTLRAGPIYVSLVSTANGLGLKGLATDQPVEQIQYR